MPQIKVRGIYTINIAPDKRFCGYCEYKDYVDYENQKLRCNLFKVNLKCLKSEDIERCNKCLKGEVK